MIQRKQTLFLLLAVIVCALGLFLPIASIALSDGNRQYGL